MANENDPFLGYFEAQYKHLNILTPEQYDKMADAFERVYAGILPKDKGSKILDIGCGCGHFLYYLEKKGYRDFLGIDISEEQVNYCRENISKKAVLANALEYLKGKDGVYDVISAHDVMEHMPKDMIIEFLRLVRGALKIGGIFIVRVPNMSNPLCLDSRYGDFTHEVGFTAKSLYQALWNGGFRDINVLADTPIKVRSFKNLVRKGMIMLTQGIIRLLYYIQDFHGPKNLGVNLVAVAKKQ